MIVRLGVKDRLVLANSLPTEDRFITAKAFRLLKERLELTTEEVDLLTREHKLRQGEDGVHWEGDFETEFDFHPVELNLIKDALQRLDRQGKISFDHIHLYELFVEAPVPS